ncbi:MAG: flavodoxin family protein [Methanomicrobiales archaeon]|nr:flavodoxin family protein [Methanomicrobiales archaeon]
MKILGINGSPKGAKSQTLRLVKAALDGARKAGAEIELVDVCKLNIRYCIACGACYLKGTCIHDDDFHTLLEKMIASEGMIWGSPVYIDSVTAQLKTVIDRMADTIHCQLFLGKYGCAVSTSGSSGEKVVVEYLNRTFIKFGGSAVGGVGVAIGQDPHAIYAAEKKAHDLGKMLVEARRTKRHYPEQEAYRLMFRARFKYVLEAHKEEWASEYRYWKNAGWL